MSIKPELKINQNKTDIGMLSNVEKHAQYFAVNDVKKTLTSDSITHGHSIQGINSGVWIKQKAILNILCDKKLCPTAHNISKVSNPASTGIWDAEGNFDEERFDELCEFAIVIGKKKIITKSAFDKLREKLHGDKDFGYATMVGYVIPIPWTKVTNGSIDELFEYYNDCWYKNDVTDDTDEPAFTVEHLRLFYTDTPAVMLMRENGQLPAKRRSDNTYTSPVIYHEYK